MKTVAEATTRFQMAPGDTTVGSRPGRLDAQLIQATKEQGAFRCFQKPFDPGTLLAAIHAALVDAYGGDQNPALSG